MGAKAGVAVGVLTALLGIGGAAVGVRATKATPEPRRRAAVVRLDEGGSIDASSPVGESAPPVVVAPPAWDDPFEHVVLAGPTAPSAANPAGVVDRGADTVLLARVRAVAGVQEARLVAPGVVAVTTSGSVGALAAVPGVVGLDLDVPMAAAADPRQDDQWHLASGAAPAVDLGAERAWAVTAGAGVVVAVIDSGVDLAHPDLAGRVWRHPADPCGNGIDDDRNGYVDDCNGWDFGAGDNDPNPDAGLDLTEHGTHVAGLVAAGRDGVGVVGVAPESTVMALKVSDGGSLSLSGVSAAIRYAVDQGAAVVNVSLATAPGTARTSVPLLEAAVAYARDRGVLIVAGAGNNARDIGDGLLFPAGFARWYDNVVAVGATSPTDSRTTFSNYGLPAPLEVYAPGSQLLSTLPGGRWGRMSGTSTATGVVAGAAALVLASGRASDPAAVRTLLAASADARTFGSRIHLAAAVGLERTAAPSPTTTVPTTPPTTPPTTTVPTTLAAAPPPVAGRPSSTTRATSAPRTSPATTARPAVTTRAPAPTTTSTMAPLVTTPVPKPAASGPWRLTSLSVRSSPLAGGTTVQAVGVFPTDATVQVWFSGLGPVVAATVAGDGASLTFVTPPMGLRMVTEVTVRFHAGGRNVSMSLPNALTFAPGG